MSDVSDGIPSIAVLIPCYNESRTIGKVVREFRSALPDATIYVYDNNSTDGTAGQAAEAGAVVRSETRQGKGFVVQRMFADIEADIYVLVDGDDTYEAAKAPLLVELLIDDNLAMVVGRRIHDDEEAYRPGHVFGNELFSRGVAWIFGKRFSDILSGYRVFSRRLVKSFPSFAQGFEIETELTVHALTLDLPVAEVDTRYGSRPAGSVSKLHTYRDGFKVILTIMSLIRSERPFTFYAGIGLELIAVSLILAYPIVAGFVQTGLVPRFPTAILSTGLALSGLLSISVGTILDAVTHSRREAKLLAYLRSER